MKVIVTFEDAATTSTRVEVAFEVEIEVHVVIGLLTPGGHEEVVGVSLASAALDRGHNEAVRPQEALFRSAALTPAEHVVGPHEVFEAAGAGVAGFQERRHHEDVSVGLHEARFAVEVVVDFGNFVRFFATKGKKVVGVLLRQLRSRLDDDGGLDGRRGQGEYDEDRPESEHLSKSNGRRDRNNTRFYSQTINPIDHNRIIKAIKE